MLGTDFTLGMAGGLLSASPSGSYILGGLALLLLVFRVDTISN